jgi:2-methylcitrate dehydratase PrpD
MIRCALARLSEVDNIHRAAMVTPGAIVVPAVLTLAQSAGADAASMMAAINAGYEAIIRLGCGIKGPAILGRGIWPTYFATPFAVAAAAARLWTLDPHQTAHAMAIALTYSAPTVGRPAGATTSRWLAVGQAARNGLAAASAARFGFTGDLGLLQDDVLEKTRGLAFDTQVFRANPDLAVMHEVSFKPRCAAKQTMSATHALHNFIEQGLDPASIGQITVRVPTVYAGMIGHNAQPGNRSSHLTSLRYQMALTALAPDQALNVNQSPGTRADRLYEFGERINVDMADELQRHYPARWPAEIQLITCSGETRSALVLSTPGDPELPMTEHELIGKFERLVSNVVQRPGSILRAGKAVLNEHNDMLGLMELVEGVLQEAEHA